MIGLELRFLAGRYHGTGWHSAHNEAVPEWPPSPWRILRSLVSAAYFEGAPQPAVANLIEKLRGLPRYRLPRAVEAHTRHYMPDTADADHKRSKVFDAFVAIQGGAHAPEPLIIAWPGELSADERTLLQQLCRRITYLGRAESWVEVCPAESPDEQLHRAADWDCWPDENDLERPGTNLLVLEPQSSFQAWAEQQPKPKKGTDVPRSLWDVLTFDGDRYRKEGWSTVPGTRLARYVFRTPPFERAVVPSSRGLSLENRPTVARYAIRSAVLPRMHQALAIGERLRTALMAGSRDDQQNVSPVFSGHGQHLRGHQHAMYLAASDDRDNAKRGFIDHLIVSARVGFELREIQALQHLRRLWGKDGHDLELILVGLGQPSDYGGQGLPRTPLLSESRVWHSVTPFVPTRHPKTVRGVHKDSIEEQIRVGCEQLLGQAPIAVTPYRERADWAQFRRRRQHGNGNRGPDWALGARIEFATPVRGPVAIGYGAHFGLGVFVGEE